MDRRRFVKFAAAAGAVFGTAALGAGAYTVSQLRTQRKEEAQQDTSRATLTGKGLIALGVSLVSGVVAANAAMEGIGNHRDHHQKDNAKMENEIIPGLQALTEAMSQVVGRMRYHLDASAPLRR
jgi:hypothetical protein